jgi:hypothetical protein
MKLQARRPDCLHQKRLDSSPRSSVHAGKTSRRWKPDIGRKKTLNKEIGMDTKTFHQIQELSRMTVGELRKTYLELFGEETRSLQKDFLRKRIAWRIQARAEGTLSERARRRAEELADDADLRVRTPRDPVKCGRLPDMERSTVTHRPIVRDYYTDTLAGGAACEGW